MLPDFSLDEVDKTYQPFMINRYISMVEVWIPIIHVLNQRTNLSKEDHFRFLFNILPKTSVRFDYLKKPKKNEAGEERRNLLMKHFKFGKSDLECALEILDESQIVNIENKYKSGKVR
jgi:hypothetical protein